MSRPIHSETTLVNGRSGDPVLYVDYPDRDNALLFDAGDVAALPRGKIADLDAVFLTHHHADHFMDLDRVIRANLDSDKTLDVFGPEGTIQRVYDRIRSYAHSYFPFQKLVLMVRDLRGDRIDIARIEYQRQFPPPMVTAIDYAGAGEVFANETVSVSAAPTDHTVPGWAYALTEKPGWRFRFSKLAATSLRAGPWIGELIAMADDLPRRGRGQEADARKIRIDGGVFDASDLAQRFLQRGGGYKIAWVVDTRIDGPAGDGLRQLIDRADRLYGDCFYADAQTKAAVKHQHCTTSDLATLCRDGRVASVTPVHHSGRYAGREDGLIDEVRQHLAGSDVRLEWS